MVDSNLNITIRVAGRQAQAQLRAVARDLDQVQKMVGKKITPGMVAPSSQWSPAIAKAQARQQEAVAKQAAAALSRIQMQAARQQTAEAKRAANEQTRTLEQAWRRQQTEYRANLRAQEQATRASQMAQLREAKEHEKKMSKLGGLSPLGFAKNLGASALVNAGKNINWVGRQLTYNFTLPIAVAGTALFKFSQDVERSTINLRKVYGDIGDDQAMLSREVDLLSKSFELLSTRFGVNQTEVVDIAGAWAAAGAAGSGLAEATRATLETMILGDMDAQKATEGLIAIQAQWRFSTLKNADGVSELTTQLAYLNAIENATGISTEGLVDVIQRAGGNARTSGASLRELAALAAALVPATGDAAQAGTALRSIISSLQSPTAASTEALSLMGITVSDPSWLGADSVDKLRILADHFVGLSDAQQGVVSSTIATKWQVSRFDVLMRDIASGTGYFQKALDATANTTDALAIRARELRTVLESSPKAWDIMVNATRNALAKAFIPMIPAIMSIVKLISELAVAFENLNPDFQKWILIVLTAIAVLGPLMSVLGSTMQLFGVFGAILKGASGTVGWFIKNALFPLIKVLGMVAFTMIRVAVTAIASFLAALGPIGWAIIAAIALITAAILIILNTDLEDRIWDIIVSIAKAFWELPKAIAGAMMSVARVIGSFMVGIIDALSYLNPFARHSPSLVDNVKAGVATILDEYSKFNQIPGLVRGAANALQNFSTATNGQGQTYREHDLQKKADESSAANPAAKGAADAMVQAILNLERSLPALEQEINDQEMAVAKWASALKDADAEIKGMEKILSDLEKQYDSLGDQINAANQRIGELADTPIEGMTALGDAIFDNELAQNKLNMELLQFEKQGMTLDSIRDKYAAMAGEIETLQGTQAELRNAGAGSDILGWYDDQIQGIRDQKQEMGGVEQQIVDINKQLDALDLEGRFLELTKAINFDPLERQIDKIVNKVVEMPFDEIVKQIREQQGIIEDLTPKYEAIGKQIEKEKENIEAANTAREAIAAQLDAEQAKLDALKEAYSDIKGLISDMEGALNDFASSAEKAADEASRLQDLFDAAEGLNFDDQGGNAPLGREGGEAEIQKFIDDMNAEIAEALANMGTFDLLGMMQDAIDDLKNLDFLGPIKDAWGKVEKFFIGIGRWLWDHIYLAFWFAGGSVVALYLGMYKVITTYAPILWNWIWDNVVLPIGRAFTAAWDFIIGIWNWIFENLLQPVVDFGTKLYNFLVPIVTTVWGAIVVAFQTAWGYIEPVLSAIWGFIDGYIVPIFELMNVVTQIVLTAIALLFMWLWENAISKVLDWIKTGIGLAVDSFNWWKDKALEALGILGDSMSWWYDNVIKPIFDKFQWAADHIIIPAFNWVKDEISRIWNGIGADLGWVWDNVINPIWDKFRWAFEHVVKPAFDWLRDNVIVPVMDTIYTVIAKVWNGIASVIEGGVNFFIKAFNLIAAAVNAVAGFLQIDARVSSMTEIALPRIDTSAPSTRPDAVAPGVFAAGGIPAAALAGGRYNTPRAIVGEGSSIYPEFVIPTDPQYRGRALGLLEQAGTRLLAAGGVAGTEVLTDGTGADWQGTDLGGGKVSGSTWVGDLMKKLQSVGATLVQGAIAAIWKPGKFLADKAIDVIPNGTFRGMGHGIMNALDSWVMGRDSDWNSQLPNLQPDGTGGTGFTGSGASNAGIPISHGSGSWQAFVTLLNNMNIPFQNLGTYANRGTKYGTPSMHAQNRAMDFGGTQMQLQRIDHALYDAFKTQLYELIWTGPDARNVYKGNDHQFRAEIANDHRTHVHASMAQGGRFQIPRVPGGVNLNVSEGRSGEQFQILPIDDDQSGGTTIIIQGDLSFPNIKNGGDAKDFIDNLRALAQ